MNLSKEINDKHIFGISKLLSFIFFASKTAALKQTTIHQTGLFVKSFIYTPKPSTKFPGKYIWA